MIDGRPVRINLSNQGPPKTNTTTSRTRNEKFEKNPESETLFVGNLSWDASENSIRDFFSDCGEIVGVRISLNENGRPKGFCHVEFESVDSAVRAMQKSGEEIDGRAVRLDFSKSIKSG